MSLKTTYRITVVLLMSGCVSSYPQKPNQEVAQTLIWRDVYMDTQDSLPVIQWVEQVNLDCEPNAVGVFQGFNRERWPTDLPGADLCVGGETWVDPYMYSQIAWPDDAKFYRVALAHESLHQLIYLETGDGDPGHTKPAWGKGFKNAAGQYNPPGLLDFANDALRMRDW